MSAAPSVSVDLAVTDTGFADAASLPAPVAGDRFAIRPQVASLGPSSPDSFALAVYLSPVPALTANSVLLYTRDCAHEVLATPNGLYVSENYLTGGGGTLPAALAAGNWYPVVVVNPDHTVPESDYDNNTLVGPALVVAQAHHDDLLPPLTVADTPRPAGSLLTLTPQIGAGGARAYRVTLAYALSNDSIPGNGDDVPLGAMTFGAFGPWEPGGPVDVESNEPLDWVHTLTIPADLPPGDYHLVTTIDPNDAYAEPDESNNIALGDVVSVLPPGSTDLIVEIPTVSSAHVVAGSELGVSAYPYRFFGPPSMPTVGVFLLPPGQTAFSDAVRIGSYQLDSRPTGVNPDHRAPLMNVTIPADLPAGRYRLLLQVDPDNQIIEYDENNNACWAFEIEVTAPVPQPTPPADPPDATPNPTPDPVPPPAGVPAPPLMPVAPAVTFRPLRAGSSHKAVIRLTNPTSKARTVTVRVSAYFSADAAVSRRDRLLTVRTLTLTLSPRQTRHVPLDYTVPGLAHSANGYVLISASMVSLSGPAPTPIRAASPAPVPAHLFVSHTHIRAGS